MVRYFEEMVGIVADDADSCGHNEVAGMGYLPSSGVECEL
jgi:hypothetical protein